MDVSQSAAAPIISRPTRLRLITSALKYLAGKALTILVTIFVGVFITMLIVNYPPGIGSEPNKSPFEVRLESEIDWIVKHTLYSGTIIVPGPIDYEAQAEILTNQLRAEAGLDLPYWPRNLLWTFKALTFDWGELDSSFVQVVVMGFVVDSDTYGNPVLHYLPNTLLLVGTSYLLVFLLGLPLALYLARNYGNRLDRLVTILSPISSVPSWVFAVLLIALFAVQLRWLPVGGMSDSFFRQRTPIENILMVSKHMVLPVIALVLSLLFQLVYAWRTFFIIYSEEDYVELARAKGLDNKILERQYILRPALPYIITSFTTSLIGFWQLTVALESVFQWPGIGLLYIGALPNYWGEQISIGDLMIVIQIVVIFAYLLGILVFILDVVYVLIDPRIHLISNNLPTDKNAGVKTKAARLAHLFSIERWRGKSPGRARQVKGPRERRGKSLSETLRAARDSIREAWARSGLFFQELHRYPSAIFGLAIILVLLAGSLYAVLALPYEEFGRSYNEDRVSGSNLRPRVAAPTWFNLFSGTPRLSTLIMNENNASVSTSILDNGWAQKTVTFTFQYTYGEMPSDVFLYLDPTYNEKFPFVSLVWKTPDGRVLNLKPIAVGHSINYDFREGVQVSKFLNGHPEWKDWFVESGQYATPAYQLLFAQPGATQPKTQTGEYQLEVSSIFFEANSDLRPQLVLLGQVYGLAGTDFWRRDLVVPLFWGMPFVLFIGLLGTFITTLVALVLPAVGVWYGGWPDNLIQRLTEVNMVLPGLAIVVLTNLLFGVNVWIVLGVIVVLNAFGSPIKSFRSAFLQAKEAPYIEMARSYGASNFRIITRYLVPRILPVFIPQLVTQVPSFIFLEATLGFFNINSHYPSWGRIIYDGLAHGAIYGSPFWVLEPIFLLLLTGLAFAMLGSALERILNPRIISDISVSAGKEGARPRKSLLSKFKRQVAAALIVATLAIVFIVPTIQGKTLASFVIHFMDETRKLHSTNVKPPAVTIHTSVPITFTATKVEVPALATEPLATPTPPITITPTTQASCIPANPLAIAKVLEIVDGNTIKVYMNDLVYVVRYIGMDLPQDDLNAMNSYLENSELVFQKDVSLIADVLDKDANGRLLRYVLVGDTFVNLQLIQDGQGKAIDIPPNASCAQVFKAAEDSAIQSAQGIWAVPTSSP